MTHPLAMKAEEHALECHSKEVCMRIVVFRCLLPALAVLAACQQPRLDTAVIGEWHIVRSAPNWGTVGMWELVTDSLNYKVALARRACQLAGIEQHVGLVDSSRPVGLVQMTLLRDGRFEPGSLWFYDLGRESLATVLSRVGINLADVFRPGAAFVFSENGRAMVSSPGWTGQRALFPDDAKTFSLHGSYRVAAPNRLEVALGYVDGGRAPVSSMELTPWPKLVFDCVIRRDTLTLKLSLVSGPREITCARVGRNR
jgi:hypothetical protein